MVKNAYVKEVIIQNGKAGGVVVEIVCRIDQKDNSHIYG
jgi:hypothetical protein